MPEPVTRPFPPINDRAAALTDALVADAEHLRVAVERGPSGVTLIDAGIDATGGLEAGRRIAELCMADLGTVSFQYVHGGWPCHLHVHTARPVLACLASQYAGWSLTDEGFFALGSGPARALAAKEPLFEEFGYRDRASKGVLVLEVDRRPPEAVVEKVLTDCGLQPEGLTLVLTPTASLAGCVQVVARVLEVALHKAHSLDFPLGRIVDGWASAPLPPPSPDFLTGMGRTNDAILFGGNAQLFVTGNDDDARDLAERLPASASRDYGRPFAEVFAGYDHDFFRVDPLLFSPAQVRVSNLDTGRSFAAGELAPELLDRSFGGGR